MLRRLNVSHRAPRMSSAPSRRATPSHRLWCADKYSDVVVIDSYQSPRRSPREGLRTTLASPVLTTNPLCASTKTPRQNLADQDETSLDSNTAQSSISMAPTAELSHLVNPLATLTQLETSSSQLDGIPKDLEDSIRFTTFRLMQAAGTLLRLPQEIIAQSIVLLQRYWLGADGGSLLDNDTQVNGVSFCTSRCSGNSCVRRSLLRQLCI